MILTGPEIRRQVVVNRHRPDEGIVVDPFDSSLVGPNSVDLRLGRSLLVYENVVKSRFLAKPAGRSPISWEKENRPDDPVNPSSESSILDMRRDNLTRKLDIEDYGIVLRPGILYLGTTVERIGSNEFVPIVEGRSSVGRLGIHVHVTAGFCDIGFFGQITLEIHVVHPVRVYAGTPICQAYFLTPSGSIELYNGRYQNQDGPVSSRLHCVSNPNLVHD